MSLIYVEIGDNYISASISALTVLLTLLM